MVKTDPSSSSHSAKSSSSNNRPRHIVLKNQNPITGTPASALPKKAINRIISRKRDAASTTSPSTSPTQRPAGTVASGNSAHQLPSGSDPQSVKADQVPDTPIITKRALDIFAADDVVSFRLAQLNDIGSHIKELSIESFLETLLPSLDSAIDLDNLRTELKQGPQPTLADDGWSIFSEVRPNQGTEVEDDAYADLEKVFEAIIETNPLNKKSFIEYTQNPTLPPSHSRLKLAAKPDGVAYVPLDTLNNRTYPSRNTKNILWGQIVFCGEFKKADGGIKYHNEVVKQVLGVMCQIMRDEPRRRFVYGFTIENCRMRLWYIDRSEVVVSSPFDIMKEPKFLIHFVIALAYAPSLSMLGFDSTCQPDDREGQFVFDVRDDAGNIRQFYTMQLIHSAAAEAVRGRATRVWAVKEKGGDPGKMLVLKDTWVECTRTREGTLMEQIIKDVGPELKKHLLTVVCHGNVYIDGQADTTRSVDADYRFLVEMPSSKESKKTAESLHSRTVTGSVADREAAPEDAETSAPVIYGQRAHYRIVFEEVGEPLRCVENLDEAFIALATVTQALSMMHAAGWVHRDISVNNIIWVKGQAKLADLEYAKRQHENPQTRHELRTASQFFTAVEVSSGEHLFLPTLPQPEEQGPPTTIRPRPSYSESQAVIDMHQDGPVHHNHLHDLEAVFWIAVYFIWYREVTEVGDKLVRALADTNVAAFQTAEMLKSQQNYAIQLFEGSGAKRRVLTDSSGRFSARGRNLHPAVICSNSHFDQIRDLLVEQYAKLESTFPKLSKEVSTQTHKDMRKRFTELSTWMRGISISPHRRLNVKQPAYDSHTTRGNGGNGGHSTTSLNVRLNQVNLLHQPRKAEGDLEAPRPKRVKRDP
ncbi:hypothetical protein EIP86_001422 [Pleurotus ostreatoroseus]|nr:hypothetical protein EIP86_001422 [Pleurotus ostreatoroseus]